MTTVLLQDDPALWRGLEESLLRREGVRLTLAADGNQILALAEREPPDLAILLEASDSCPTDIVARRLTSLPNPPACVVLCTCDGEQPHARLGSSDRPRPEKGARFLSLVRSCLDLPERAARRHSCRLRAAALRGEEERRGLARDLSEAGVFIVTRQPWSVGDGVRVILTGSSGRQRVEAGGAVVRAVRAETSGTCVPGMAVAFDATDRLPSVTVESLSAAGVPE